MTDNPSRFPRSGAVSRRRNSRVGIPGAVPRNVPATASKTAKRQADNQLLVLALYTCLVQAPSRSRRRRGATHDAAPFCCSPAPGQLAGAARVIGRRSRCLRLAGSLRILPVPAASHRMAAYKRRHHGESALIQGARRARQQAIKQAVPPWLHRHEGTLARRHPPGEVGRQQRTRCSPPLPCTYKHALPRS